MASYSGYDGSIAYESGSTDKPTWNATITRWSLEFFIVTTPTPKQQSTTVGVVKGTKRWRASVSFLMDTTDIAGDYAEGQDVQIRFRNSATDYFTGTGVIERFRANNPIDGPASCEAVIVGNDSEVAWVT